MATFQFPKLASTLLKTLTTKQTLAGTLGLQPGASGDEAMQAQEIAALADAAETAAKEYADTGDAGLQGQIDPLRQAEDNRQALATLPLPTLSLNAALGEYLSKTGLEAPGKYTTADDFTNIVTFTRLTPAWYPSGESQLAEQNLVRYSQDFDLTAYWFVTEVTVVPNIVVAPDGSTTADELVESATASGHVLGSSGAGSNPVATLSGETYTGSFFFHKGDGASAPDWIQVSGGAGFDATNYANFNLSTGAVGTTLGVSASIVDYGGGWYRCAITLAAAAPVSNGTFRVHFVNNSDALGRNPSYAGSTDANVFVWGAQVEQRDYASDYTPTTDQPITRYQPNVYKEAAIDEPRFAHNLDGTVRGLMVEQGRTNLLLWSNDFSNAVWSKIDSSVRSGAPSPFDGESAFKLVETASTSATAIRVNTNVTSGTQYTYAVVVKAAERTEVNLSFGSVNGTFSDERAFFDIENGVVLAEFGTPDATSITPLGGGYFLATVTATCLATAVSQPLLRISVAQSSSYTGDGYSGLYVAHIGLYEGSAPPLAPIVNEGAAITQGAEQPHFTSGVSVIPNPDSYTAYVEAECPSSIDSASPRVIQVDDGDNGTRLAINTASTGSLRASQWDGTQLHASQLELKSAGGFIGQGPIKSAVVISAGTIKGAADSTVTGAQALDRLPPRPTEVHIGAATVSAHLNGYIKDLKIYPVALTDEQLKALTA